MPDYQSIYTGVQIDGAVERVLNLETSTGQSDVKIMSQKAVTDNIDAINTTLNTKVDKVSGKGLSTNDFYIRLSASLNGASEFLAIRNFFA